MIAILLHGTATALSLIIAIGAQNAFVLKQGLKWEHVGPVVAFCALSDALLFSLGAMGFGALAERQPLFAHLIAWAGIVFLIGYGAHSFRLALTDRTMDVAGNGDRLPFARILPALFAVTYLNPHALLDTLVLVGGIAAQYPWPQRGMFTGGAALGSLIWFTALGFGAGRLASLFRKPAAWKLLDSLVGLIMWGIAARLLADEYPFLLALISTEATMSLGTLILISLLGAILFMGAIVMIRTLRFPLPIPEAPALALPDVAADAVAQTLAGAIRCQTVSVMGDAKQDAGAYTAFEDLHVHLKESFPRVHEQLSLTQIGGYSLLYTWQGKNPALAPVLLMAHQDVVPVDPATLPEWEHPPFDGVIADGYVWGRGAIDIKCMVITELAAVEALLKEGFIPERTLYLAFGHDEEIGGVDGATQIVAYLKAQGVTLGAVLDEGGTVTTDALGEMPTPIAVIGTSEKGILTLALSVEGTPGHSSTPPKQTAIGILAAALAKLEAHPMPARPEMIVPMIRHLGGYAPVSQRLALANLWLLGGMVTRMLAKNPMTNAMIRTTAAITMIGGGVKDNVLPREARAAVNFRLLPGDSVEGVIARVKQIIGDDRVSVAQGSEFGNAAAPLSPTDVPAFETLADAIRGAFGNIPVAPYLMMGASDSRHYAPICPHVYRFIPAVLSKDEVARVHAANERISVENVEKMTQFFMLLVKTWDKASF